nr:RNA-directed DNA polymerase, eukaryota [Tanacetum cinerariifolium]
MASLIPKNSCGNILAFCATEAGNAETSEELADLLTNNVKKTINSFSNVCHDSEDGQTTIINSITLKAVNIQESTHILTVTSWSKFPFYEADFGFGKPTWAAPGSVAIQNSACLMDDAQGNGVDAHFLVEVENVRIKLGSSLQVSHLFYADDAIFIGQWNQSSIDTITWVLDVFYRASGLRINIYKSKLMGILVDANLVKQAASKIGCMVLTTPFRYLGSKVGGLMSRIQSWSDIIEECDGVQRCWWSWGIEFIRAQQGPYVQIGVAFCLQKKSLWARVISALHGDGGKIGKKITLTYPSIWMSIVQEIDVLKLQGLDLMSFIKPKLGNGLNTSFWDVPWRRDTAFKELAPRVYALETLKGITVAAKLSHSGLDQSLHRRSRGGAEQSQLELLQDKIDGCILSNSNDRWSWSLDGVGDFTVSSVRIAIDDYILPKGTTKTRWIKEVLIKINIHAWKVKNDCFPTRFNMSQRGMEIDTILCPLCNSMAESSRHFFFSCKFSRDIMLKINRWWEVDHREVDSNDEWVEWMSSIRLPIKVKKVFEGICYIVWWYIWNWRNMKIFGHETSTKASIFDEVVSRSFHWI